MTTAAEVFAARANAETHQPHPLPLVNSDDIHVIVKLTQAAYDAISVPDSATLYVIVG